MNERPDPVWWRMLCSGKRTRIATAVAQIQAAGQTDDYARWLLEARRRNARRAYLILGFRVTAARYSERARRSALTALGLLWGGTGRALGVALDPYTGYDERGAAFEVLLRKRDQRAVPPLIEALLGGHAPEDWRCVAALGLLGDADAADALVRYMGFSQADPPGSPLDSALEVGRALRRLNARAGLDSALISVEAGHPENRARAALVLAGWGDPNLGSALMPLLKDDSSHVRQAALTALGELRYEPALSAIQSYLGDADVHIAAAAERAARQVTLSAQQRKARRAGNYAGLPRFGGADELYEART